MHTRMFEATPDDSKVIEKTGNKHMPIQASPKLVAPAPALIQSEQNLWDEVANSSSSCMVEGARSVSFPEGSD